MRNIISKTGIGVFALASLLAAGSSVSAEEFEFKAFLNGGQEVPAVTTPAGGFADITYDTKSKKLSWTVEHAELSGDVGAAHFHGPAAMGENAGPAINIEVSDLAEGTATLDAAQEADLMAGRWYLNLHTAANPGGEIRGQVIKAD